MIDEMVQTARRLVEKAAANTGDTVFATIQRPKSQAYLLGRLTKEFPDASDADAREALVELARIIKLDPTTRVARERRERPPKAGCEPVISTVWIPRIEQLLTLLTVPRTSRELCAFARRKFRWTDNFYAGVVTAGEFHGLLEYEEPFWMPVPKGQRRVSMKERMVKRQVTRPLEVIMTDRLSRSLIDEQDGLYRKKQHLEQQLDVRPQELRATIGEQKLALKRCEFKIAETQRSLRHGPPEELGRALGELYREKERLETAIRLDREELKLLEVNKEEALAGILKRISEIGEQHARRVVVQPVECEERIDYEKGIFYVVRLDTFDTIERRPLTDEERQLPAPFPQSS